MCVRLALLTFNLIGCHTGYALTFPFFRRRRILAISGQVSPSSSPIQEETRAVHMPCHDGTNCRKFLRFFPSLFLLRPHGLLSIVVIMTYLVMKLPLASVTTVMSHFTLSQQQRMMTYPLKRKKKVISLVY